MDPFSLLAAIVGGGASIAGGLIGADAQSDAADKNWQINLLNYYAREAERRERIRQAGIERHDRQLGMTDANGNRVHFVPGRGWVTELSGSGQAMNDAQNAEQMARLTVEQPARRKQLLQNLSDQDTDRYMAGGALDAYKRSSELPFEAGSRMRTQALSGTNQNWDNIVNAVMRNAVRTGSSNVGRTLTDLMAGRTNDTNTLGWRAYESGAASAEQGAANKKANALNIYNAFSNRSRGMPNTPYTPQNVTGNADKILLNAAGRGDDAGNQLIAAYGAKGGTLDYVEPLYGTANAVSGAGQAIASSLGNIQSYYDKRRAQGSSGWGD